MHPDRRVTVAGWLGSFAVLVVFQLLGTAVVALTGVDLPGTVVGLALLGLALTVGARGRTWRRQRVEPAADTLLELLPLLFVPAGVGVVAYLPVLGDHLGAVVVALVLSFAATLLTTGGILELLVRRRASG
ncbi:CidA/LrgA family protein [Nakamurella deserti]|uniref:CidA/LrgA family protein n=1 Tax=Nakamurella deserti TaxID=2164074 RepID=UPI00197C9338|nr:CidA/LrgA family protein [Nakamurella deserti]